MITIYPMDGSPEVEVESYRIIERQDGQFAVEGITIQGQKVDLAIYSNKTMAELAYREIDYYDHYVFYKGCQPYKFMTMPKEY